MSAKEQLAAHVVHLEQRLAHAIEFRYGVFVAKKIAPGRWAVKSDDDSTLVEFIAKDGVAQDEAIREAALRARRAGQLDTMLVYCTRCLKEHAVTKDEKPCEGGRWLDPESVR